MIESLDFSSRGEETHRDTSSMPETESVSRIYTISNLSLFGPRLPQSLIWQPDDIKSFLVNSEMAYIDWTLIRKDIPIAHMLWESGYRDSTGDLLISAARQSFITEGRGVRNPFLAPLVTIYDIGKEMKNSGIKKGLFALAGVTLMSHMEESAHELDRIRKLGLKIPIAVYPESENFKYPEQIQALGGTTLIQLNHQTLQTWSVANADDLQDRLKTLGLSGIILDTTLLQEEGVISTLSRRRNVHETSYPGSITEALHNTFSLGLLGETPIIDCSFLRSDLSYRISGSVNDMDEGAFSEIVSAIGMNMGQYPKEYQVVIEPNPIDFMRKIKHNKLGIVRTSSMENAVSHAKEYIDGLLTAGIQDAH